MEGAKVTSVDALRSFRAALIKFAETTSAALTDGDGDVRSTLMWLERDQTSYWSGQIRKRHDALERAKEALRHKQLYKSPTGGRQSDVDEQHMVAKCKAALAEAETKLANVKKSISRVRKQMMEFTGQTTRLSTTVQAVVPGAVAELDRMVALLDEYVALGAPELAKSTAEQADAGAMGRAAPEVADAAGKIDWARLRTSTPSPAARGSAPRGLVSFGPWKTGAVKVAEQDALAEIEMQRTPVDPQQMVILARNLIEQPAFYLEHLDPAFPSDSGWYIGAADPANVDANPVSLTVGEVLAMRPDLANILLLPRGVLLGMDAHGIAALISADDTDVWAPVRERVRAATTEAGAQEDQAAVE